MRDNKKRYKKKTCYACSSLAETNEHIPPKVFFPEKKDLPSGYPEMRNNLVTVPSCEEHNLGKSKDDFYAFSLIVASFDTSYIARHQFSKFLRAMRRKPSISSFFLQDLFQIRVNGELTGATIVDSPRFENFLYYLSKGVYFHHYKKKWINDFYVFPLSFIREPDSSENIRYNENLIEIRKSTQSLFTNEKKYGSNPEVFYYQIHQEPSDEEIYLRMIFYGGFEIMASEKFK
jgi:hypothetical protein